MFIRYLFSYFAGNKKERMQLIDGVQNLKTVSAQLVQYADTGENIRPALRAVEKEIDAMIEAYNQRENIMKGFVDGKE